MENNNSRRKFLKNTVQAAAIITVSSAGVSSLLASCSPTNSLAIPSVFLTGFNQQPLPYAYDALENVIDAKTMEIHFSKHAAAYSKALKEAATAEGVDATKPLENVLAKISKYSVKMRNNAGGHYNHEMFWKSMQPKKQITNQQEIWQLQLKKLLALLQILKRSLAILQKQGLEVAGLGYM